MSEQRDPKRIDEQSEFVSEATRLLTRITDMIEGDRLKSDAVESEFNQFFGARIETLLDKTQPLDHEAADNLKDFRAICRFVWRQAARKYGAL